MNPEEKKNHRGGSRLQKPEKPQREKKPRPQRTRQQKALRILYIVLTVIAALIVAGFVIFNFISAPPDVAEPTPTPRTTTYIDDEGNEVEEEIPGLAANRKDQFYTFLITGISGGNTDTMLLAAYDVPNQTLNVMSLPRDTYVKYNGRTVMINSVYSRGGGKDGGVEALKGAVATLTGVTPDFYVLVEWEAVGRLVDAIGGVYFDVPFDMYYNDLSQDFKIDLKKGYQLLDGEGAMGVLRWRHNSIGDTGAIDNHYGYAMGDLGRIETQQAFLKEVVKKCLQPEVLLPNLMEYINIFQENVTTDLTVGNLAYFGKSAIGKLDMDSVEFVTLPNKSAGDQHLLPVGSQIVEMVNDGFNPYEEEITLSDLDLATRAPGSSSSSSSGSSSRPSTTPAPTPTPDATPSESPSTQPGMTPVPEVPSTPGGSTTTDPGITTTPSGGESTPPATQSPAVTDVPVDNPAESTAPDPAPTPEPAPTPAVDPDAGAYGPGMEPIE